MFIDTAGLRDAGDEIEAEGIRRSRQSLAKAELILHVLDASEPFTSADENYLTEFKGKKRILVLNKADLPRRLVPPEATSALLPPALSPSEPAREEFPGMPVIEVSCRTGAGLESLKDAIKRCVWSGEIKAEMLQVMINSRHQDALQRAHEAVSRAAAALRGNLTLELVAMDLRIACNAVGEIVGKTSTEDLLDSIFSQFCIGK